MADREKALEEAFFRKESRRLLTAMRTRDTRHAQFEALSKVLGLRDARIIDPLLDLGLKEESVTALVMTPLIAVAWADRTLDREECRCLLEAEKDFGIDPESEAGQLLAVWLDHRPHSSLMDAWFSYVSELCTVLEPTERARLRDDIVSWSWRIAHLVEKSLLRGGAPTSSERAVFARIEEAFRSEGDHDSKEKSGVLDQAISSMS
ncbi:MAG: hypothetical protein CL933_24485 [Deltaproteobacteria bacterium]|nr:hypothetical protein [Deltaproteobacteria bacterium]